MSKPAGAIRESEEDIAGGEIENCGKSEQRLKPGENAGTFA
jgi:hypothetical protein